MKRKWVDIEKQLFQNIICKVTVIFARVLTKSTMELLKFGPFLHAYFSCCNLKTVETFIG